MSTCLSVLRAGVSSYYLFILNRKKDFAIISRVLDWLAQAEHNL